MNLKLLYKILFALAVLCLISCSDENYKEPEVEVEKPPEEEKIPPVVQTVGVREVKAFTAILHGKLVDGGSSVVTERGICFGENENPTIDNQKLGPNTVKGSGEYDVTLTGLKASTLYYARAYAINAEGVSYGNAVSFTTLSGVSITDKRVSGTTEMWIEVEMGDFASSSIKQAGLVYSKNENPSINDGVTERSEITNKFVDKLENLEENTTYYLKPYTVYNNGDIDYGEETQWRTIKKGNFTWSFNGTLDMNNPVHVRIKNAFDEAVWYYNNYTSITKHVTVNYSPGTPTANANFDGWINMGPEPSYQRTGTALHEMAHTVGVGTHWRYDDLFTDGRWKGEKAEDIIQMMSGNPDEYIRKSGVHFWPYGINGAHEDTGSEELYRVHSLIIQGMKEDGLPSN